jgi:hypothetical protein
LQTGDLQREHIGRFARSECGLLTSLFRSFVIGFGLLAFFQFRRDFDCAKRNDDARYRRIAGQRKTIDSFERLVALLT